MDYLERCIRCIIPRSVKEIAFDENGVCELCNASAQQPITDNNEENLEQEIEKIRLAGKGRPYDCLVGVSGGRDSSYLLYLLVTKHNLRCMAAYHRTPYTPDTIDANIRRLTKALDVPLIEMDISKEKHQAFARKMMQLYLKKPDKILINLACVPCKQHNFEVYKVAKKHNIGHIVFGSNKLETFQLGAAQSKNINLQESKQITLWQKFQQMLSIAGRGAGLLLRRPELILHFPIIFKASILFISNRSPYLRLRFSNIKMLDYYYLADYDEKAVHRFLKEVDWQLPENCNSTWRADCSFDELKNYMFRERTGMTYVDAYLSNLVRAGKITREEALLRAGPEGAISPDRFQEVCDILKLPVEDFTHSLPV